MIRIRIYGCSKNKVLKRYLLRATIFFLNELLPNKRNIEILVRLVDNLVGKESAYGECYNYSSKIRPSNYVIQLDSGMAPYDILTTFAHEMVHAKQFDKKELIFLVNCSKWKGERFSNDTPAAECPWEQESVDLECKLADAFIVQYPKFKELLD